MNRKLERAAYRWHLPPLVARELLVGSRQPWTYWLRLLTALGAVSVLALLAATGHSRLGRTDGFTLFAGSTTVLFFIASLNGLRSTADCISAERRQGTLVLLFLASLKLDTILVSKLVDSLPPERLGAFGNAAGAGLVRVAGRRERLDVHARRAGHPRGGLALRLWLAWSNPAATRASTRPSPMGCGSCSG